MSARIKYSEMKITRENLENRTALLRVDVKEDDYKTAVDKSLRDYRRKANIPGFRPGMVPIGMINKMYRKGVVAEEAYKIATQACVDELDSSNTKTLGELMPSDRQKPFDFDNDTEFEFVFEIGLAPDVDITLDKKDKVVKYSIKVSADMLKAQKENFMRRFGKLEETDKVTGDEALTVTLDQDDMKIEEAYVGLISMNDDERKPFIGKKVGDKMKVNVNELYKTPSQRAAILNIKEDELDSLDPEFSLEIAKIRHFVLPEQNEEFFKMAFPDGSVTDEKGFDKWAEAQISGDLSRETGFKFVIDMKDFLVDKAALALPDEFLKNWLLAINEGKFSKEDIEKEYPSFSQMMKWDLVQRYYMEKLSIEITPEEAKEEAKTVAAMQFAYYGMPSPGDDMLENYSKQILSNREEVKKIYDKLAERKIVDAVKDSVTVTEKKITAEEFNKLFE